MYAARSKPPDTIQTVLPKLTVSSRKDLQCSRKWHELRVSKRGWGSPREFPVSVGGGSALHSCLQNLHAARWEDELPLNDLPTYARQAAYSARYGPGVSRDSEAEIVEEMARLFLDNQHPEDVTAIIALESQIEFDYIYRGEGLARISATIDRVLCRPETPRTLIIQDFKTTKQRLDLGEAFILLWCAARKWPEYQEWTLELIWIDLEQGQVTVDVIPHRICRGQLKLLTAALLRVKRLPPTPEPSVECCLWCPMRQECQGLCEVRLDDDGGDVFRV